VEKSTGADDPERTLAVTRLDDVSLNALARLLAESELEGWRFLRRLVDDWDAGLRSCQLGKADLRPDLPSLTGAQFCYLDTIAPLALGQHQGPVSRSNHGFPCLTVFRKDRHTDRHSDPRRMSVG
jgi:hypothetical protein